MSGVRYLILENGAVFKGRPFGSDRQVTGEVVFTTGMTGYLETLTDKSYYGQLVTQTFPLIGNYGVIPDDFESDRVSAFGYIVRQWCRDPSNFRMAGDLDAFLKARDIPGICGVDTRTLAKTIREAGVMNGRISDTLDFDESIKSYKVHDAVENVSCREKIEYGGDGRLRVALWDFGMKENIRRELQLRGCRVTVFPWNTSAEEFLKFAPDGIMLSNGPGDPEDNVGIISQLEILMRSGIPTFGICLGHQLMALAAGCKTEKLKYGHRGANQPARDLTTGRAYITSQNHGYAVVKSSINPEIAGEWFENVNDGTCEGIKYKNIPAFSVQFHPEACGGPKDTEFLFDEFIDKMEAERNAKR